MSHSHAPTVESVTIAPGLIVPDVRKAVDFYVKKLGFTEAWVWEDPPIAAGVKFGGTNVQFSKGTPVPSRNWISFQVTDVDELYAFHKANGVEADGPPEDRPWSARQYQIQDLNGYCLEFTQFLMQREPALPIERVDVPVRLEKRLAALLVDLAKRKRMTVGETLEETLLHTFEELDGGVASPHTPGDLAFIQKLKDKHGIDYDCHASYRFRERQD